MSEKGHAATKFLQNITDDLSLAKFEVDKNQNNHASKLLQQALDDVAMSKYLNNANAFNLKEEQNDQRIHELKSLSDIIDLAEDPLDEADLALIQEEEAQWVTDLALSQQEETSRKAATRSEQEEILAELEQIDKDIHNLEDEDA